MRCAVTLTITSPLPTDLGHIPISAEVEFGSLLRDVGSGDSTRLDPTSVEVVDLADGSTVPHHLGEAFAHGDCGRVEFVICDPTHTRYELRFTGLY